MVDRTAILADHAVQIAGLLLGALGSALLIRLAVKGGDGTAVWASAIYCTCLILMFACSIANAAIGHPGLRRHLRALDHAAIYLLIAGTYTPVSLLLVGGTVGLLLLTAIWTAAGLGISARLMTRGWFAEARIVLYVLMGWSGVLLADRLLDRVSAGGIALLLAGGLVYSLAAPIHRLTRLRFHSALWHGCVVLAAACHWAVIWLAVNARV